jgi:hypothetical protein
MEDADYFRQKVEQCRRLAGPVANAHDPVVANLLAFAVEFEAKAVALTSTPDGSTPTRGCEAAT